MLLSDLQNKSVINIYDGKLIGNIVDVEVDKEHVISFIVEKYKIFTFFNRKSYQVKYSEIEKIGKDVILVNINKL